MAQNQNSHCFFYLLVLLISSLLLTYRLLSNYDTTSADSILINHQPLSFHLTRPTFSSSNTNANTNTTTSSSSTSSSLSSSFWNSYNNILKIAQQAEVQTIIKKPAYDFDTSFVTCYNQSTCIQPKLQVTTVKMKLYLCKHTSKGGVRFFYLVRDGLLLHPSVIWVDDLNYDEIDYLIYLPNSSPWQKSECSDPKYAPKLIVLDEFDGSLNFAPFSNKEERLKLYPVDPRTNTPIWNYLFFKRSYVRREDGIFIGYPHIAKRDVYPMVYSIASGYIQLTFNQERYREITCTLRGSEKQTTRLRVQQWVTDYIRQKNLTNSTSAELDRSSRQTVSQKYFQLMASSQIIVTVNPSYWEGDFRLWESMSTGALVFCDHIMVPHPYPLIDGQHIIYFNSSDQSDLWNKLDYYLAHPEEARVIAWRGYLHAMQFHRTANFIDYVLRTALTKRQLLEQLSHRRHQHNSGSSNNQSSGSTSSSSQDDDMSLPHSTGHVTTGQTKYTYTGQYLVHKTLNQMETIKQTKLPGNY